MLQIPCNLRQQRAILRCIVRVKSLAQHANQDAGLDQKYFIRNTTSTPATMPSDLLYEETLKSSFTTDLFGLLTILFLALFVWRASLGDAGFLSILCLCLFLMFLFYSLNYRVLRIHLTSEALTLRFGIFEWDVPVEGIRSCSIDETSLWRVGGAGIHFSFFKGNYRAMFNFLEYPRVVLTLKPKRGPVCEIAFSSSQPEQVIHLLTKLILEKRAA